MIRSAPKSCDRPWLIVAGDFSRTGGMDRANYALAWHLAEHLARPVTLVAHQVAEPLATHSNVHFIRVARPRGLHLLGQPFLNWVGCRAAAKLTAAHADACVLVNGGNCHWPGVNWVHMVHHACPVNDAAAPLTARLKTRAARWMFRHGERASLRVASLILANSEKTRRELIDLLDVPRERTHVVYLASDRVGPASSADRNLARKKLDIPSETPVLLFVGALGYDMNKGLDTILAAMQLEGVPGGAVLLVAGGGRAGFWQHRVHSMGLHNRVRFLGLTDDMAPLFAAADLLVSPTRYDAYGLAVHEALCYGRPAIVSRRAGVAERYPLELEALLLNDPESPAELADRIALCFTQGDSMRSALERFGADLGRRTWNDVAAEIIAIVETTA